jgi:hypothetical protein
MNKINKSIALFAIIYNCQLSLSIAQIADQPFSQDDRFKDIIINNINGNRIEDIKRNIYFEDSNFMVFLQEDKCRNNVCKAYFVRCSENVCLSFIESYVEKKYTVSDRSFCANCRGVIFQSEKTRIGAIFKNNQLYKIILN